ncbi:hypothetical membrane protein [Corynebacterium kutscheri]|uniref:Hypothetical membrane protein n=1 Tax=Corynebacterium kutscheri TaxID=35755 RepID=A0AB38VPN5_9CORY|nr:DUF3017 domain-containing protein [Corynebacterium kutscheri]VEH04775.1 hypothetical membrane protein [Corynebacterium kutscheri]VEH80473.1 hypothetical membrane protein [Corynebacterium kutscheri]
MLSSPLDNPHDKDEKLSTIPRAIQIIGIALFVVGVVISGLFAVTEHWRRATFVLGAALLWLSALRVGCDSKVLGVLAVRSRIFDVCFTTTIGGLMVFLSASVDSLGS